jgi:hypothetical protein
LKEYIQDEKHAIKDYGEASKEDPSFHSLQSDEKRHASVLTKKFNYAKKKQRNA